MKVTRLSARRGCRQAAGSGFTVIELLIVIFIIGTVVTGVFGLFVLSLRSAQEGERRLVAIALANERAEMVRNLPYVDVGTLGGVPAGSILQEEAVSRNGNSYTVRTDIRYVDDPYDGEAGEGEGGGCEEICHAPPGNPDNENTLCVDEEDVDAHVAHGDTVGPCEGGGSEVDLLNTDYKQVRIQVSWQSAQPVSPLVMLLYVAPAGVEGGETAGTLDFQALDAAGVGVAGAELTVVNDEVDPAISITTNTNEEGRVILPGLPQDSNYYISVTKDGYTLEQTYDTTAEFVPDPEYSHLTMAQGDITPKTFFIDQVASLDMLTQTEDETPIGSLTYAIQGTKTIGVDGDEELVYVLATTDTTANDGTSVYEDLVWDSYAITVDGVATGYDIKETSEILPVTLDPGDAVDLTITLVPHTDTSLHVSVVDAEGAPINNATVRITATGVDEELGTGVYGQVFFADLPVEEQYTMTVSAPGFAEAQQIVSVEGTTRDTVLLSVSE